MQVSNKKFSYYKSRCHSGRMGGFVTVILHGIFIITRANIKQKEVFFFFSFYLSFVRFKRKKKK